MRVARLAPVVVTIVLAVVGCSATEVTPAPPTQASQPAPSRSLGTITLGSAWSSPLTLSDPVSTADQPSIALAPNVAVAVWRSKRSDGYRLESAIGRVTAGSMQWATSGTVAGPLPTLTVSGVRLARNGSTVLVGWNVGGDAASVAYVASGSVADTVRWAPAFMMSHPADDADGVRIALSDDGQRAWAMWARSPGTGGGVWAAAGVVAEGRAHWGSPELVAADSGRSVIAPSLVSSADGQRAAVNWFAQAPGAARASQLVLATLTATDSQVAWGAPRVLDDDPGQPYGNKLVGTPDLARMISVWSSADQTRTLVHTSTFEGTGGDDQRPATQVGLTSQRVSSPRIAASRDLSRLMVVREVGLSGDSQVQALAGSGSTWSTPSALSATGDGCLGSRVVGTESGQRFLAVWYCGTSSRARVSWTWSGPRGTEWDPATSQPSAPDLRFDQQAAVSADGGLGVVTWPAPSAGGSAVVLSVSTRASS